MANRTLFSSPLRLLHRTTGRDHVSRTPPLLDEPSLFYDPPYDDPVDDAFAWHLVKYLQRGSGLRYQVDGPLWEDHNLTIDFVVEHKGRRVGFMCGASPEGTEHDRRGDALRIGCGRVDVLYRLRADDIEQHLHDALLLVARWDADLFSDRGRLNLNTLATPEARTIQPRWNETIVTVCYDGGEGKSSAALRLQRLSQSHPDGWMPAYEQAFQDGGVSPAAAQPWARSA
jgi:hypothetical protein